MKVGRHTVKLIGAGVKPNKKGNPQPFLKFENKEGQTITWFGNLSTEKTKVYAAKALVAAGFRGVDWEDLSQGMVMFTPDHQCSITVEDHTYEGKTRPQVKWVNPVKNFNLTSAEVKSKVGSDSGLFTQVRAEAGVKTEKKADVGF